MRRHVTGRPSAVVAMALGILVVLAGCSDSESSTTESSKADPSAPLSPTLVAQLDAAIDQARGNASIPGVMVGVWTPAGRYVRATGVADKATQAPMMTDFYSRIGSETKTFTVTAVLQLADQGKLSLDDPISKYVLGIADGDKIPLRQLARMQSGVPSYTASQDFLNVALADPNRPFTPEQLIDYARAEPQVFPPGQGWQYSDTNTVLLGLVVEKVSGKPLQDFLRDEIFTPVHLDRTSFPTTAAFPSPHAQGYTVQTGDGSEAIATDWDPSDAWAAGAMISTLDDLRVWAEAMATGRLLTPAMQRQRLETVPVPGYADDVRYGLGLFEIGGWIGHNGSLPGYQSVTMYLPDAKTTLVVLVNTDIPANGGEPSTAVAEAVTKVISPGHLYRLDKAP